MKILFFWDTMTLADRIQNEHRLYYFPIEGHIGQHERRGEYSETTEYVERAEDSTVQQRKGITAVAYLP